MPGTEKCGYYQTIRAGVPVHPDYPFRIILNENGGGGIMLCASEDTAPHIRASDGKEIWLCPQHSRELNNLKLQHDLRH